MKEFQPCPSASSGVELPEGALVRMHATEVIPNPTADGSHESDLGFVSLTVPDLAFLSQFQC